MKLKGLTEQELRQAVRDVSYALYDGNIRFKREPERVGNFLHFTLTVKDSSGDGARRSNTGRKIAALCWHGHRDIMWEIFAHNPEAVLVTALARYVGAEDFERKYVSTGEQNIGSYYDPLCMINACECGA